MNISCLQLPEHPHDECTVWNRFSSLAYNYPFHSVLHQPPSLLHKQVLLHTSSCALLSCTRDVVSRCCCVREWSCSNSSDRKNCETNAKRSTTNNSSPNLRTSTSSVDWQWKHSMTSSLRRRGVFCFHSKSMQLFSSFQLLLLFSDSPFQV